MKKRKKTTPPEWEEQRRRARENSERLRRLAEKALADLERAHGAPDPAPDDTSGWLLELAEKAQAELDTREQQNA
jgi:hypothetical protein